MKILVLGASGMLGSAMVRGRCGWPSIIRSLGYGLRFGVA